MDRVVVIGCGGAGKSRLATAIAERTGLPLFHLDKLFWKAGWQETDKAEWLQVMAKLVTQERWVIDGNYSSTLEPRITAADTVVFLDRSRFLCLWRLIKRRWMYRSTERPDMAKGCEEHLNWEFVRWIWNFPATQRPRLVDRLRALRPEQRLFVLNSDQAAEGFLRSLSP